MDGRLGAAPFSPAQLDVGGDMACSCSIKTAGRPELVMFMFKTRLAISVGIVQVARGHEHTLVLKGE